MSHRLLFQLFLLIVCGLFVPIHQANAQVVSTVPVLPSPDGAITITFYADRGTAGLKGFNGEIYAHTGVITSKSTGPADWRYVKTNWGQNTPETKLTKIATDRWNLTLNNIRAFYNVPTSEQILKIALVFRSANSTQEGKDTGGKDIFIDLLQPGATPTFVLPSLPTVSIEENEQLPIQGKVVVNNTELKQFALFLGDSLLYDAKTSTELNTVFSSGKAGNYTLLLKTIDTANTTKTATLFVNVVKATIEAPLPKGIKEGVQSINDSTVVFCLFAPYHKTVHLIGDFNDYAILPEYQMKRMTIDKDSAYYWMEVSGLNIGKEYGYQFIVDGSIRIADPYATKVLHEFNDDEIINQNRYPSLKKYPKDKTDEYLSVFTMKPRQQIDVFPYGWNNDFKRFSAKDLIIYELLVRDFTDRRTFRSVIDSLDYLQKLGINAIELMPVTEFEGNLSWGYDPAFPFALDKYYGSELDFKELVDKAHQKGMAIILDVVLNHITGASPLIRMWADGKYGPPSAQNPYANVIAKHPFNVFNDMNHESKAYQRYIDRFNAYWLQEFHIDGYRFDLSKGFTQVDYGTNVSRWSSYDSSRVRLLKRMYNQIRTYDSSAYLILEHFADSREERELTDYGFLIWHNMNPTSSEAVMGWINGQSDGGTSQVYYKNRSLNVPANIAYMESHDEERLMKKNFCYGKTATEYSTKDTTIALQRAGAMAAMFFPVPGPRMIWQFGELGYDAGLQLTESCVDNASIRLSVKPQKWSYRNDIRRKRLYDTYSALIALRQYSPFNSLDTKLTFKASRIDTIRTILFEHPEMNAFIIANFDMKPRSYSLKLPIPGIYYDYFSGSSLNVPSNGNVLTLQPGEFHVFTSKSLPKPEVQAWPITSIDEETFSNNSVYPHPVQSGEQAYIQLNVADGIGKLYDMKGALRDSVTINESTIHIGPYESGIYMFIHTDQAGAIIAKYPIIIQ